MAIVVAPEDVEAILAAAAEENVEASLVAEVTELPRLVMELNGEKIVNLSREFVNSNGAPKNASFAIPDLPEANCEFPHVCGGPAKRLEALVADLNICSKRGLVEMFDSSIGAASVMVPFAITVFAARTISAFASAAPASVPSSPSPVQQKMR